MDADLQPVYEHVMGARRPEDVFDDVAILLPPRLLREHLVSEMAKMLAVLDEAQYSSTDDKEAARSARAKLERFHADALERATKGLYRLENYSPLPPRGKEVVIDGVCYFVGEKFHVGRRTELYRGSVAIDGGSGGVVFRVAQTPGDNAYQHNEIRVLEILHRADVAYWKSVPFMLARFETGGRIGIVYRYFDKLTLEEIRSHPRYISGLPERHVVWVMDRMLSMLGYVHSLGLVHGRITPVRVRIRPSNHNALLTGWGGAVYRPLTTGEHVLPEGGPFEAPEVTEGREVGPWTDIYALGKTLIWLLGGDPETNIMPSKVNTKIQQFIRNMVRKHPKGRPTDAWQLYEAQNRLKDSLWDRQFIHLDI